MLENSKPLNALIVVYENALPKVAVSTLLLLKLYLSQNVWKGEWGFLNNEEEAGFGENYKTCFIYLQPCGIALFYGAYETTKERAAIVATIWDVQAAKIAFQSSLRHVTGPSKPVLMLTQRPLERGVYALCE